MASSAVDGFNWFHLECTKIRVGKSQEAVMNGLSFGQKSA